MNWWAITGCRLRRLSWGKSLAEDEFAVFAILLSTMETFTPAMETFVSAMEARTPAMGRMNSEVQPLSFAAERRGPQITLPASSIKQKAKSFISI